MLTSHVEKMGLSPDEMKLWHASIGSYAYYWAVEFGASHDPSRVLGQDNILKYVPHRQVVFRMGPHDSPLDAMRIVAAALTCGTPLQISGEKDSLQPLLSGDWQNVVKHISIQEESEGEFLERCKQGGISRIRFISTPSLKVKQELGELACNVTAAPPLANGRIELARFVREVSLSIDYHRYGNLGAREEEARTPIL
jgi:RHH-type proline utilization regulon transcriptional repressor/proline dehydrogenase/delta 1-pyrroline-5-carboxylate dehydrogenase